MTRRHSHIDYPKSNMCAQGEGEAQMSQSSETLILVVVERRRIIRVNMESVNDLNVRRGRRVHRLWHMRWHNCASDQIGQVCDNLRRVAEEIDGRHRDCCPGLCQIPSLQSTKICTSCCPSVPGLSSRFEDPSRGQAPEAVVFLKSSTKSRFIIRTECETRPRDHEVTSFH